MKPIASPNAPAAVGPYSQAIQAGNTVYTSGCLPLDLNGNIPGGVEAQTRQSLDNLMAVLSAAGCTAANVVKTTCFIRNMNDFAVINEIYAQYFHNPYPARSCVEAARLPKDVLIEIEAVAVIE